MIFKFYFYFFFENMIFLKAVLLSLLYKWDKISRVNSQANNKMND